MASKINIVIDQGTTFDTSFIIHDSSDEPINFTDYTGQSMMRKSYSSSNSHSFDLTLGSNGQVSLHMAATTTNNITPGRYVYDIEVESNVGVRSRLVEGIVTVTPQVTR